jgi:hypothetical protein
VARQERNDMTPTDDTSLQQTTKIRRLDTTQEFSNVCNKRYYYLFIVYNYLIIILIN